MKSLNCLVNVAMFAAPSAVIANQIDVEFQKRPNVIIFLSDDVSYNDLECYGSQNTNTPNLNKLVEDGMKFNNCFQTVAMSSPTRHSLYTGLYPVKSGAYPNHTFVYDDVKSYVQYFGDEGYRTALYGKEHVKPKSVFNYDYLGNYKNGNMDFEKINNYISSSSDPFFMVVASHEAHHPFTCGEPEKWDLDSLVLPPTFVDTPLTRLEYRKYLAEIEVMDRQVGATRKMVEDNKLTDNTIFIFLSEQGSSFPFAKWTCYGQGLQSAMIVSYPKAVEAGEQSDALVEYIDLLPTVMEFAGIDSSSSNMDGESFAEVLKGNEREHKKRVFGLHTNTGVNYGTLIYGIRTVSDKKYRYIKNLIPESTYYNLIQRTDWWAEWVDKSNNGDKFAQQQIYNYEHRPQEELYDLVNDPLEMNNIALDPKYKGVIKKMRKELDQWMESQGDKGIQTDKDALYRLLPGIRKKYENNPIFQ